MTSKDLSVVIHKTYVVVRVGLFVLALAFPVGLYFGGKFLGHLDLQCSMSAYYHASPASQEDQRIDPCNSTRPDTMTHPRQGTMRDWFVGVLFAVGAILFLYQGVTVFEDLALDAAGALAWGVAWFPMPWGDEFAGTRLPGLGFPIHDVCAVSFFVFIAYVSIFRAGDTINLVTEPSHRKWYAAFYQILGWAMPVSIGAAVFCGYVLAWKRWQFWAELAGILVFALFWIVKTWEITHSDLVKAIRSGRARIPEHKLTDAFRRVPVTVESPPAH